MLSMPKKASFTLGLACLLCATSAGVSAQTYPARPVRLIVPFAPGGGTDITARARSRPGALNFGSSGTGGLSHLAGALFSNLARIDIVHVPYKGGNPALIDVLAGQIQMLFSTLLQANPHLKSGTLRALAVTTAKRSPAAPRLPTMQEAGVAGYEVTQWYGIVTAARTPPAVIARLSREIMQIMHEPDVKGRLAADGSEAVGSTPEQFG
ncbi:MAG: hypothetical protein HY526_06840, partial [Betaproteobacteria bacterium]|nr:hypothetical protein [Betaproteobacteria bacterium]